MLLLYYVRNILTNKSKYWFGRIQDNASELSDMSIRGLLVQWASTKRTTSSLSHLYLACSCHAIPWLNDYLLKRVCAISRGWLECFKWSFSVTFPTALVTVIFLYEFGSNIGFLFLLYHGVTIPSLKISGI